MLRGAVGVLIYFAVSACGEKSEPIAAKETGNRHEALSDKVIVASDVSDVAAEEAVSKQASEGAKQVVMKYFDFIQAGEFAKAWSLRERKLRDDRKSENAFARSFDRYAEYKTNVGEAGPAAQAGQWTYVEVPVQLYGRLRTGEPFSSAGTISVRRSGGGAWLIHT